MALAALDIVAERGVEGLTHRAVAQKAGVPLGSTTYHFKALDDLLAAAIRQAKIATDADLDQFGAGLGPDTDIAAALAEYLLGLLENSWGRTVVELELYMAALRRPQLLALSQEWDQALPRVLSQHLDAVTAQTLSVVCDGLVLRAMIHGMPTLEALETALRRAAR